MLTSKERAYFRKIGHDLQPIFQIGKGGVTPTVVEQFRTGFNTRELIKATVLQSALLDTKAVCREIANAVGAEEIQVIGSKFILYKKLEKK